MRNSQYEYAEMDCGEEGGADVGLPNLLWCRPGFKVIQGKFILGVSFKKNESSFEKHCKFLKAYIESSGLKKWFHIFKISIAYLA